MSAFRVSCLPSFLIALASCGDLAIVCTTSVEPALEIEIRDSITNEVAAFGARGAVRDGAYSDSLRPRSFESGTEASMRSLAAADERPGTYDVSVVKPGYRDWSVSGVQVTSGACHVQTVHLLAKLVPEP